MPNIIFEIDAAAYASSLTTNRSSQDTGQSPSVRQLIVTGNNRSGCDARTSECDTIHCGIGDIYDLKGQRAQFNFGHWQAPEKVRSYNCDSTASYDARIEELDSV
jgi:hypothetical protein